MCIGKEEFISIACRTNTVITYLNVFVKRRQVLWESLKKALYDLYVRCYVGVPTYATVYYR